MESVFLSNSGGFFVVESDLKHALEFMCESDSPIKMDLSDIPHVAESEKTSSFFLFFFLTKHTKWRGRGEGRVRGWSVCVYGYGGGSFPNAC